jgi:hypothetical protein
MYGSFALGQGDSFSDIEFYVFFDDEASRPWRRKRGSVVSRRSNSTTSTSSVTVTLSFEKLVRGEFHFEHYSNVGLIDA